MHFHFFFSPHTTLSIHSANLEVIRPLDALFSSLFNALPPFCPLLSASFLSLVLVVARCAFGQAREKLHDTSRQADESLMADLDSKGMLVSSSLHSAGRMQARRLFRACSVAAANGHGWRLLPLVGRRAAVSRWVEGERAVPPLQPVLFLVPGDGLAHAPF